MCTFSEIQSQTKPAAVMTRKYADNKDKTTSKLKIAQHQDILKPVPPYNLGKENMPPTDSHSPFPADMKRSDRPPLGSLFALMQPSQKLSGSSSSMKEHAVHHDKSSGQKNGCRPGLKETGKPQTVPPSSQGQENMNHNSQVRTSSSVSEKQKSKLTGQMTSPRQLVKDSGKQASIIESKSSSAGPNLGQDNQRSKLESEKGSEFHEGRQTAYRRQEKGDPHTASVAVEPSFDVAQMETESEMRRNIQARMRKHHAKRARLRK